MALHLQRSDTNERVQILELQSALGNLTQALRDWQLLARGTRGTKGMYHANIDPDARYKMTPEQWQRSVDVLEIELGLTGQPRAIVLHEKHGREHIHVVWQRTNVDTMTLVSDSNNYHAHERASLALETEFGHEHVPGKHAKRDRTKPFPKAEINDAEWQQSQRTGVDPRARKAAIAQLYEQSDGGQALRAALGGAGYVLAKGDRRDYVIVDAQGEVHSLARQIKGVTVKDLREFMADIDRDSIPTVEQAKALQREIAARSKSAATPRADVLPPQSNFEPDWHPPGLAPDQLAKLKSILNEQRDEEDRRLRNRQEVELSRTAEAIDREITEQLETFDALQLARRNRYDRQYNAERGGFHRILAAFIAWINPPRAAAQARKGQQAREEFLRCQRTERANQIARLNAAKECSLADLFDRHEQQRREHAARYEREFVRLTRDQDAAQRLLAEIEQRHRQQEPPAAQQPSRDGSRADPPRGPFNSRFLQPKPSSVLAPEPAQPPPQISQFIPTTAEGVSLPAQGTAPVPVTESRFLQPTPDRLQNQEVARPPARFSRFISTTPDGVAVPAQGSISAPVSDRFLTKSQDTPESIPPQYSGINSKFLRPREETSQPTPPLGPASSHFLQPTPSRVSTEKPALPRPRYSRFSSTTADGVAIPAQGSAPAPVTASRFLTKSAEAPKSAPPQYPGVNSKFLRPHGGTSQPAAAPNGKPFQVQPNTPRPPR